MNKIYKLIWSKVKNMWVVASELAKSHTKSPNSGIVGSVSLAFLESKINTDLSKGFVAGVFPMATLPAVKSSSFTITVAAIVKNEAENVPTWVQAARSCADEIVVVDTGSTDDTVKRFADYGIKCFHYDWHDDFASAKNYMISLCHGDWIVLLDGDEWFRDGCDVRKAIAKHHGNPITKAIIADWICLDKDRDNAVMFSGGAVRAFRNQPDVRYFRKVHENLTINYESFAFEPEFKMYHTGYSGSVNRSKHERNLRIMRTMFDFDNGKVEYPTDWRYIEDTYAGLGEFDKALWAADKMISYGVQEYSAAAWITKFNVLFAMKTSLAEMRKQFAYCFKTVPSVSGFRFLASIYFFRNGLVAEGLDNYIEGLRMLLGPQDKVAQEHTYWRMYMPEASALASAVYLQNKQVEAALYACKVCEQYCGQTDWTNRALADVRRVMNQSEESLLGNIAERVLPVLQFGKKAVLATAIASSLTVGMIGVPNPVFAACCNLNGVTTNQTTGNNATVTGGQQNTANCDYSSVSGGRCNTASGDDSSVSGGYCNTASGFDSSVSGGYFNTACGNYSSVSGGRENVASGYASSVFGGCNGFAYACYSTVIGGGIAGNADCFTIALGSVAIGKGAVADENYEIAIGSSDAPVTIGGALTVDGAKAVTDGTNSKTWEEILSDNGIKYVGINPQFEEWTDTNAEELKTKYNVTTKEEYDDLVANELNVFGQGAVGVNSIAIGNNAYSPLDNAISIGTDSVGKEENSVAIGHSAVGGINGVSLGYQSDSTGFDSVSIGTCATTLLGSQYATAIGSGSSAGGYATVAIGKDAVADTAYSVSLGRETHSVSMGVAIGSEAQSLRSGDVAIGEGAYANAAQGVALGEQSNVSGYDAIAIGYCSKATGTDSIAMGYKGQALADESVAIGNGAVANDKRSVVLGVSSQVLDGGFESVVIGSTAKSSGDNGIALGTSANAANCAAIAIGYSAISTGQSSVALGNCTVASCGQTVAVGYGANANSEGATAVGNNAWARTKYSVALGYGTQTTGNQCIGIGINDTTAGALTSGSIAMGYSAKASGINGNSIAIGPVAQSLGTESTVVGYNSRAYADHSVALGDDVTAYGLCSVAIGSESYANCANTVSLGAHATANADGSVALGYNSLASSPNTVSVGRFASGSPNDELNYVPEIKRRIVYVADGIDDSDVATVGQLRNSQTKYFGVNAQFEEWTESNAETLKAKYNVTTKEEYDNLIANGLNINGEGATGENAIAIGTNAFAKAGDAIAIGNCAFAQNVGAVAIGKNSFAETGTAVSIGPDSHSGGHGVSIGSCAVSGMQGVSIGQLATTGVGTSNATVVGYKSTAVSEATAIGSLSSACGYTATAVGKSSSASGDSSVAIGQSANSSGQGSIAIGLYSVSQCSYSVSLGENAVATNSNSIAIGTQSRANGLDSTALGTNSIANCQYSTAVGYNALAACANSIAIGTDVIGTAGALADRAIAIGKSAKSSATDSIALGSNSVATDANVLSLGKDATGTVGQNDYVAEITRTIQHVTAGVNDTDAVNVSQLNDSKTKYVGINAVWKDWADLTDDEKNALGVTTEAEYDVIVAGSNRNGEWAVGKNSIAIGKGAKAGYHLDNNGNISSYGDDNVAIGTNAYALNTGGVAIGKNSYSNGGTSIAIGQESVGGMNGVAIGYKSKSNMQGVSIGNEITVDEQSENVVAIGYKTTVTGGNGIGIGTLTVTSGHHAVAVGDHAKASQNMASAFGENSVASGYWSTALGHCSVASGNSSTALAQDAFAQGDNSLAAGNNAKAVGNYSLAVGMSAISNGVSSVAIGGNSSAFGERSIAIGGTSNNRAEANGTDAIAIGSGSKARVINSLAIGVGNSVTGTNSIALGNCLTVNGANSGAFGDPSIVNANNSYSVGNNNTLNGGLSDVFVLGNNVTATNTDTIILGTGSEAKEDHVVSVGRAEIKDGDTVTQEAINRRIVNVGAGVNDTDAVNVKQLNDQRIRYVGVNAVWKPWASLTDDEKIFYGVTTEEEYNLLKSTGANINGDGAIGDNSIAIGKNAKSLLYGTIAIGENAVASSNDSSGGIAIGTDTTAMKYGSIALGANAKSPESYGISIGESASSKIAGVAVGRESVAGKYSVAIGEKVKGNGNTSIVIGNTVESTSDADMSILLGYQSQVSGSESIVMGYHTISVGDDNIVIGHAASSTDNASDGIAIGSTAKVSAHSGIALGHLAKSLSSDAIAIGQGTEASNGQSSAFGIQSKATGDGAVALGLTTRALKPYSTALGTGALASGSDDGSYPGYSVAVGNQAEATGDSSTAIGPRSKASSLSSIAIGNVSSVNGTDSVAIGSYTTVTAPNGIAIGNGTQADSGVSSLKGIAIGYASSANGLSGIALGDSAKARTLSSVAIGDAANVQGLESIAVGKNSLVNGTSSIAIGKNASAVMGTDIISIGTNAKSAAGYNVAIGRNADASSDLLVNSVALGSDSIANVDNSLSVGHKAYTKTVHNDTTGEDEQVEVATLTRRIMNVSDGIEDTDVATVGQLNSQRVNYVGINAVFEDWTDENAEALKTKYNVETKEEYDALVANGLNIHGEGALGKNSIAIGTGAVAGNNVPNSLGATEDNAVAIGNNAKASNYQDIAIGDEAFAHGQKTVAIGNKATTSNGYDIAIGYEATTTNGAGDIAIGKGAFASNGQSIAIGYDVKSSGQSVVIGVDSISEDGGTNIVIGEKANAKNFESIAIGYKASAPAGHTIALGEHATANATGVAIGNNATLGENASSGTAIGDFAKVTAADGTAVGIAAEATATYASAFGDNAKANGQGSVAVGIANAHALDSIAVGSGADAYGEGSVAIGAGTNEANANYATAVGYNAKAVSVQSTAIGNSSYAKGERASALGNYTTANGERAVVLGNDSYAYGSGTVVFGTYSSAGNSETSTVDNAVVVGSSVRATAPCATVVGVSSDVFGQNSLSIGHYTHVYGTSSVAMGDDAVSNGNSAVAIGNKVGARVDNSVAIGNNTYAYALDSVALGSNSISTEVDTISIGKPAVEANPDAGILAADEYTRRIVHVKAGVNDTDAVNVKQLNDGLYDKANWDASNIGRNLSVADDEYLEGLTEDQKAEYASTQREYNLRSWGQALGAGTVTGGDARLVTGDTLHVEVRPAENGTYVKTNNTTGQNLLALDQQLSTVLEGTASQNTAISDLQNEMDSKANVGLDNITDAGKMVVRDLAKESVKVVNGTNTTVTEGTDGNAKTYAVNAVTDGAVADGNTGIVTGGTVYSAIQDMIASSGSSEGKANVALDNVTEAGHTVIKTDAKSVVNVAGNSDVTVTKTDVDGVDTYNVAVVKTGTVSDGNEGIVTGDTVYDALRAETRPSADGNYITSGNTAGANLTALDTQVKINADAIASVTDGMDGKANASLDNVTSAGQDVIRTLAKGSVKVADGTHTTVTEGTDGDAKIYVVNVSADGLVADGDTGIVTGGAVYNALQTQASDMATALDTKANKDASNVTDAEAWGTKIATGSVAENDVKAVSGDTVYRMKTVLESAVSDGLDGKANVGLDNISTAGEGVVKDLAKGSVNVVGGVYATVDKSDVNGVDTYTVNVDTSGAVTDGDTKLVTGGVVYNALQTQASDIATALDTKANKDASNVTDAEAWGTKIATGLVAENDVKAVSGDTVYRMKTVLESAVSDGLDGKANVGLDNISTTGEGVVKDLAKGSVNVVGGAYATVDKSDVNGVDTYTVNVDTSGAVTDGDTKLVTGGVVYNALQDQAVAMQNSLDGKADVDASNVVDAQAWGTKIATGSVAENDVRAISGDTAYRMKTALETAMNTGLDSKANNDLSNLTDAGQAVLQQKAISSVKVGDGDNTTVSSETDADGNIIYKVKANATGTVAANDTGLVDGGTVYEALENTKSEMTGNISGKADKDLGNITDDGKEVVKDLAKDSVSVESGTNAEVVKTDVNGVDTYTVNVAGNGQVAENNTGLMSGGTMYDELRPADGNYVRKDATTAANLSALDTKIGSAADGTYIRSANTVGQNLNVLDEVLYDKANVDASNIGRNLSIADHEYPDGLTAEQKAEYASNQREYNLRSWGQALGAGTVTGGDARLITGDTLHVEVRPANSGTYVRVDKTTGENLLALDEQLSSVVNGSSAQSMAISDLVNEMANKANIALDNINADGVNVVRNIAKSAVVVADGSNTTVSSSTDTDGNITYRVTANATGSVTDGNTGLVDGGMVYTAIENAKGSMGGDIGGLDADGNYIRKANTVAQNLVALDTQVRTNADGLVAEQTAREMADTALRNRIGTLTADGNYIAKDSSVSENLSRLDTAVKTAGDTADANAAAIADLKDLSNITAAGETVIKDLAKGSVSVINGTNTTVTEGMDGDVKTFAVNVVSNGAVADGDTGLVSGGTVKSALDALSGSVDAGLAGKANVSLDNVSGAGHAVIKSDAKSAINVVGGQYATVAKTDVNGVNTYTVNVATDGSVADGNRKLVTGGTVYNALQDVWGSVNTSLAGKANTSLDNLDVDGMGRVRDIAKSAVSVVNGMNTTVASETGANGNVVYKVNVSASGSVVSGNAGIMSGGTMYNELRPADGNYVARSNTTAANLTALDAAVKEAMTKAETAQSVTGGNAVVYDTDDRSSVTLGGTDGTAIHNVADGAVTADSKDAVTGGQLYTVKSAVDANTTAIAGLDTRV